MVVVPPHMGMVAPVSPLIVGAPQLSTAEKPASQLLKVAEVGHGVVIFTDAGQETVGGTMSCTVTICIQVLVQVNFVTCKDSVYDPAQAAVALTFTVCPVFEPTMLPLPDIVHK
jgi:hypothetical protein